MPVRVRSGAAPGEPDLDLPAAVDVSRSRSSSAAAASAGFVVLVGDRRAEDAIEVRALVPEGQLQQVSAYPYKIAARHEPARRACRRLGVVFVVDPGEADEQRDRGAARSGTRRDRAQRSYTAGAARSDESSASGGGSTTFASRGQDLHRCKDSVFAAGSASSRRSPSTTRSRPRDRRGLQHHLALLREVPSAARSSISVQRTSINWTSGRRTTHRPRFANGDRDLHREADLAAPGVVISPVRSMASSIASPADAAASPSSPSTSR